jgi:hypothetical protein
VNTQASLDQGALFLNETQVRSCLTPEQAVQRPPEGWQHGALPPLLLLHTRLQLGHI